MIDLVSTSESSAGIIEGGMVEAGSSDTIVDERDDIHRPMKGVLLSALLGLAFWALLGWWVLGI
jgi:hypothetical protein